MFKFLKKIVTKVVDGVKSIAHKIGNFIRKHDTEIVVGATVAGVAAIATGYLYSAKKNNELYANYLESRKSAASNNGLLNELANASFYRIYAQEEPTKEVDLSANYYDNAQLFCCPTMNRNYLSLDNIPISDMGTFGNKLSEMVGGNVNNIDTAFFGFQYT